MDVAGNRAYTLKLDSQKLADDLAKEYRAMQEAAARLLIRAEIAQRIANKARIAWQEREESDGDA